MTTKSTFIAGWAMSLGALVSAAVAFPAIADKAEARRDNAVWEARAQSFEAVAEPVSGHYAETLGALLLDANISTAEQRDLLHTSALSKFDTQALQESKEAMREFRCMAEAIYYEARSEVVSGQKAVAEVVLNRVKSKHYPNTVCGVVYEGAERVTGCQFSFTCDGSSAKAPRGKSWESSQASAQLALTGGYTPFMGRATHYHTLDVNPPWSENLYLIGQVGSHKFYRFNWRERPASSSAIIAVAPPSP